MTRFKILSSVAVIAVLVLACGDGEDGTGGTAVAPTLSGPDGIPAAEGCYDPADYPGQGPFEVGNHPVYFRFGLPEEAIQAGAACYTDIQLVVIRVTGELPDDPFPLEARNADTEETVDYEVVPVDVPGEEDGEFFNAMVELPGPGRWDFTVELGEGGSTTYRIPTHEP